MHKCDKCGRVSVEVGKFLQGRALICFRCFAYSRHLGEWLNAKERELEGAQEKEEAS